MFNTIEELLAYYDSECEAIARQCEEEGYPSHGSNYDLRCAYLWDDLKETYPYLFDEDDE